MQSMLMQKMYFLKCHNYVWNRIDLQLKKTPACVDVSHNQVFVNHTELSSR